MKSVTRVLGKGMEEKGHFLSQSVPASPSRSSGSEFSLLDLWQVLSGNWKLILATITFSVLGAIIYLATATPVYETEAILLPPEAQHVSALNLNDLKQITEVEIYAEFVRNLKSNSLRRQFFDQNNLGSVLNNRKRTAVDDTWIFKHRFNDLFKIKIGTNNEAGFVSVSLRGEDPELIKKLLDDFVVMAAKKAINEIIAGIKKQINNEMEILSDQIQVNRLFAKELRLDRIAILEEQLAIARELNISSRDNSLIRIMEGAHIGFAVTTADEPLYLRGIKELSAEKDVLEKRKNDDPFISDLREKQIRLAELESGLEKLQTSTNSIYAARVDQKASSPEHPVKPRKILVLVQGLVLGGVLGVFTAFLANFIQQRSICPGGKDSKAATSPVS